MFTHMWSKRSLNLCIYSVFNCDQFVNDHTAAIRNHRTSMLEIREVVIVVLKGFPFPLTYPLCIDWGNYANSVRSLNLSGDT